MISYADAVLLRIKLRRNVEWAVFSQPGIAGISDDLQNPAPAIAAVKSVKKFESPEVRLLNDILSINCVPRQPARKIVCRIEVRSYRHFKISYLRAGCQKNRTFITRQL